MSELVNKYTWIDKSFFEKILTKKTANNSVTVHEFVIKNALGKGENYSSHMLRATVSYSLDGSDQRISDQLIIKAAFCGDDLQTLMDDFFIFQREYSAYRDVIPKVEALLKTIDNDTQLAAKAYELSARPPYFVFEDLSLRGFRMQDRKIGLDCKHLKLTMQKLAQFHATTAVMYANDPSTMQHHNFSNFNEEQRAFYPLFENSLIACADQAKKWPGFERIVDKMYALKPSLMRKGCQVYTRDESTFNVLTHGDLWVNNTMFRYNDHDEPTEVMLVDYAVGYFGSPAIDLSYLLFTSCTDDLYEQDFDRLLQHYHAELVGMLKKLNYPLPIPSLLDIQIQMLQKGLVGVMFAMFLPALRLVEDTADADLSSLLENTETALKFRERMFNHPRYAERMKYMLDYFDRKGYLE